MQSALLVVYLIALVYSQSQLQVRPVRQNGVDYINLANPALAYIANLNYDPKANNSNSPAIWFTADKSNPNLWLTRVNLSAPFPNDWWYETGQLFASGSLTPFIALDTIGDTVFGCALPTAVNNGAAYDTALQAVYYSGVKGRNGSDPTNIPGYSFYSIVMDQDPQPGGGYYGYTCGWADDDSLNITGFFIARVVGTTGPTASITLKVGTPQTTDILSNLSINACYDLWTTVKKPYMWLDKSNGYLYVAVTGRCAYVIRVTLPTGTAPFSSATTTLTDPAPSNAQYLSSAARDPVSNILYMAIQSYDRRVQAQISSISLLTMMSTNAPVVQIDTQGQAKTVLVFGMDGNERNLFALAAGSTEAYRYTADQNGVLTPFGIANLPPGFRDIGSSVFVGQYLYFTTYSPDAVLARVHKNASFCTGFCGTNAFCNFGICDCQSPWKKVYAANGTLMCQNPTVYDIIEKEVANEAAAIVFGVFFAFALVAAMAGWFLWWRAKTNSYQSL